MNKIEFNGKFWKNLKARIRRRNARFKAMSRKEQRIAIAKDVIEQLNAKKLVPAHTYLTARSFMRDDYNTESSVGVTASAKGRELADCTAQSKCQVCGIGSLFVAAVEFNDKLKADELEETGVRDIQVDYLAKWFDKEQLDLVETYYENNMACFGDADWESPIYQQKSDRKRMKMIMENIISNDGRFDPYSGKHAVPSNVASE